MGPESKEVRILCSFVDGLEHPNTLRFDAHDMSKEQSHSSHDAEPHHLPPGYIDSIWKGAPSAVSIQVMLRKAFSIAVSMRPLRVIALSAMRISVLLGRAVG